jgi:hypothetical protein
MLKQPTGCSDAACVLGSSRVLLNLAANSDVLGRGCNDSESKAARSARKHVLLKRQLKRVLLATNGVDCLEVPLYYSVS